MSDIVEWVAQAISTGDIPWKDRLDEYPKGDGSGRPLGRDWWRDKARRALLAMPPATEQVAQWMIKNGYATGHGDTVADLLGELEWQAKERGDPTQDGPR